MAQQFNDSELKDLMKALETAMLAIESESQGLELGTPRFKRLLRDHREFGGLLFKIEEILEEN